MGGRFSNSSQENIHHFDTEPIEKKAGSYFKKVNFWGIFKAPFSFIAGFFTYLIGEAPSPFIYVIDTLFDVYFQNITQNQSKFLVKTLNEEFDKIFNSIKSHLEGLIKIIIEKDDIIKETHHQFENKKDKFINASEKSKDINILLIGKTGVGKSTLINVLLRLDKEQMAKESIGNVGTLEFISYSSNHWKNINLIDSRGFDFGKSIECYQKDTINYIKENNMDKLKFIDIVYYCFKDNRFENEEKQLLLSLKEIYNDINVPFIFVYTQDVMCNFNYMKEYIKKELNDNNLIVVDVLARDVKLRNGNSIASFGISELKAETIKKISDIKNTAFYKKFYKDCLNILYNSEKIETFVLNNIIQNLIEHNRKKYTFGKYGQFDNERDSDIIKQIKEISNSFVQNFDDSLVVLSELVREYQAESRIRGKRKDKKNEYELNSSEKKEKENIINSCNLSDLQNEIKKLILAEYTNCLNKFIEKMFEKELKHIFNYYIDSMIPMINI